MDKINATEKILDAISTLARDLGPGYTIGILAIIFAALIVFTFLSNFLIVKRLGYKDVINAVKTSEGEILKQVITIDHEKEIRDFIDRIINQLSTHRCQNMGSVIELSNKKLEFTKRSWEAEIKELENENDELKNKIQIYTRDNYPEYDLELFKKMLSDHEVFQKIDHQIKHTIPIQDFDSIEQMEVFQKITMTKLEELKVELRNLILNLDETYINNLAHIVGRFQISMNNIQKKLNDLISKMDFHNQTIGDLYKIDEPFNLSEYIQCATRFDTISPQTFLLGIFDQISDGFVELYPDYIKYNVRRLKNTKKN